MAEEILNFIGGEHLRAKSGGTLPCYEPATGLEYAKLPDSDAGDLDQAVVAAKKALPGWLSVGARDRAKILRKLASLIEENLDPLSHAESIDSGKPLRLARTVDIPRSAYNFEFFADATTQFSSEFHAMDGRAINYTLRQPMGVVGCISPWNLPLYLLTWKLAPALAAGCCVVAKPSEVTPMTAYLLSKLCAQAGLPPGVLNIVHGLGAKVGAAMSAHPGISAISFTGSTLTGARIASDAGPKFKKLSLEMGGKNPNIVFADCHFEKTLDITLRASFTNQGQICLCGPRIFVEKPLYAKFRDALVEKARALKVGDPLEASTDQGAVVSEQHQGKILSYLEIAKKEGGKFLTGGKAAKLSGRCAGGWFVEPTLIEGLGPSCQTNQDEIFGPVATIAPFDSESQAVAWANESRYGLAASLHTRDLDRAHRVAQQLHFGIVWTNCWMMRDLRTPFGGVKESGVGREGGWDALKFFTEPKNVCVEIAERTPES